MAGNSTFGGSVKLTGESEYKQALSSITQNLKVVSAEMKATTTAFDAGDKSEQDLTQASKSMSEQLSKQKDAIASLKNSLAQASAEYDKAKKSNEDLAKTYDAEKKKLEDIEKTLGKDSDAYREQEKTVAGLKNELDASSKALNAQEKDLNKARIQVANAETQYNKTAKSVEELGQKAEQSGEEAVRGSDGFTVMKGVLANLATQAINACIDGLKNLGSAMVDVVNDVGAVGDEIDKSSQKLGVSSETYQELSYAMERSGTSIDTVKKGMVNITKALDGTANGVAGASDAFDSLGVSLTNADGSMKSSEQVLLDSIDALASMEDETARNAKANEIFGKSYQELAPLLNSGADGIKDLMQEASDYGMVMSQDAVLASASFEDSLTKLQGTFGGLKNNMVGAFLPSVTQVINGFTDLVAGADGAGDSIRDGIEGMIDEFKNMIPNVTSMINEVVDMVLEIAPDIITALADGITTALPQLMPVISKTITTIVSLVVKLLPQIIDAGIQILTGLIQGIADALPDLIAMLPEIIQTIVEVLVNNIPLIIEAGLTLLMGLVDGILQALPLLIEMLPQIIETIVTTLIENLPLLIEASIEIMVALINGLVQNLPLLVAMVPRIITTIVTTLIQNLPKIIKMGGDILASLIKGILSLLGNLTVAMGKIVTTV
ncbi:MAG: hypothetical protein IIZ78_20045, partial [Clostridiales bacterium]|nr:hypothetical protein [Clostridiales bacterium]